MDMGSAVRGLTLHMPLQLDERRAFGREEYFATEFNRERR
jgi:hypothetical protein